MDENSGVVSKAFQLLRLCETTSITTAINDA